MGKSSKDKNQYREMEKREKNEKLDENDQYSFSRVKIDTLDEDLKNQKLFDVNEYKSNVI